MTPWQLDVIIKAEAKEREDEHKLRAWAVWHIAALGRAKKLPKLKELTEAKAKAKGIDEDGIKAALKAYQERRKQMGQGDGAGR